MTEKRTFAGAPDRAMAFVRHPALRRGGWAVVDQGLSSLSNFVLALFVARAVEPREFGAFALLMAAYVWQLGVVRASTSVPYLIRTSSAGGEGDYARKFIAAGLGVGTVLAVVGLLISTAFDGSARAGVIALSACTPLLMLQDCWRFHFFANRQPRKAAMNDAVWLAAQVLGFLFVAHAANGGHDNDAWPFVLAWGVAAGVAALVGFAQTRLLPYFRGVFGFWRSQFGMVRDLVLEFFVTAGAAQSLVYLITAVSTLVAAGSFRAAQVVLGVLLVPFQAAVLLGVAEAGRLYSRDPRRLMAFLRLTVVGMCLATVAYGGVLLLLPDHVGRQVLGENWGAAKPVLFPMMLAVAASTPVLATRIGFRAMAATRESLLTRCVIVLPTLTLPPLGAVGWGPKGAAYGLALAALLGSLYTWQSFKKTFEQRQHQTAIPSAMAPSNLV